MREVYPIINGQEVRSFILCAVNTRYLFFDEIYKRSASMRPRADLWQVKDPNPRSEELQFNPADHSTPVARYNEASSSTISTAIDLALTAKPAWEAMPFADRAAVFLKAADLISGKYRYELMAATILGQGKNAWQAEIDAAAELCDFLR